MATMLMMICFVFMLLNIKIVTPCTDVMSDRVILEKSQVTNRALVTIEAVLQN